MVLHFIVHALVIWHDVRNRLFKTQTVLTIQQMAVGVMLFRDGLPVLEWPACHVDLTQGVLAIPGTVGPNQLLVLKECLVHGPLRHQFLTSLSD